ncbi:MAG: zf-TFIIB domain-containing protein [Pseudomonas neustonica]
MHCPKCKNMDLKPTKLDDSLPVMGCTSCEGSLLSLLYYRDWAERVTLETSDADYNSEVVQDADSKTALSCPKCARLMTKYSVTGALNNRIDLCSGCDEAWLDGGEWQLLKSLALANKLPSVFSDQWQRKVRQEQTELARIERLKKVVGEEDTERAIAAREWLSSHPNKAAIVQFLAVE